MVQQIIAAGCDYDEDIGSDFPQTRHLTTTNLPSARQIAGRKQSTSNRFQGRTAIWQFYLYWFYRTREGPEVHSRKIIPREGRDCARLTSWPDRNGRRDPRQTVTQLMDREGGIDRNGQRIQPTRVRFFFFALIQCLSRARTATAIRTAHFFPPVMIILKLSYNRQGRIPQ